MEDVLTHVNDPNIVLETITSRQTYLSSKRPEKIAEESSVKKQSKHSKLKPLVKLYNNYGDFTRGTFIDRMLENPQERGLVVKVAKDLNDNTWSLVLADSETPGSIDDKPFIRSNTCTDFATKAFRSDQLTCLLPDARSLWYQVLHNKRYYQSRLARFSVDISATCSHCSSASEDMVHLLFKCPKK
jgi:hypothetical protein